MSEQQKSALERLESLEKNNTEVLERLAVNEKNNELLVQNLNKLNEGMPQLAKSLQEVINRVNELGQIGYKAEVAANRVEAVSALAGMVSEYLYATVSVLQGSKLINPDDIGTKVMEVKAEKRLEQEKALVQQGLLKESAEGVGEDSFFAIKEEADGKVVSIRDHINAASLDAETKAIFLAKKAGERVELKGRAFTILAVFEPILEGKLSEEEQSEQSQQPQQ